MPRKGNRCTTMVNFQLTPLEATALQAVVVHCPLRGWSKPLAFRRREGRGSVVACGGIATERTRKPTSKSTWSGSRSIGSACWLGRWRFVCAI